MNIFYLHEDPVECAKMHHDKHCVKMILEYAQLLCTAHHSIDRYLNEDGWITYANEEIKPLLYKETHRNHPSALWARESTQHYQYLYDLFIALCNEYTHRYGKVHKSYTKLKDVLKNPPVLLKDNGWKQPTQAMPMVYKMNDSVSAYRYYYLRQKVICKEGKRATWKNRDIPYWLKKKEMI